MGIFLLILGLFMFVGLVVVHEFGHFIAARRGGVEVEEFGIGFPPRAKLLTKKAGTEFSLNWLPLGGFVKLKGENDADTARGSYGAASLATKVKIMLAGVGLNLITAYLMFVVLALIGMPKLIENQFTVAKDTAVSKQQVLIGLVDGDGPASKSGLMQRDALISLNNDKVTSAESLPVLTKKYAGQTVAVVYERQGRRQTAQVNLRTSQEVESSKKTSNPKGYLGISPTEFVLRRSTWSAPIVGAGLIKQITQLTLSGLGNALSGIFHGNGAKASAQVSGPVGIFVLLKDGSMLGYQFMLVIIAIISLTLAIMNILPIPALDGGRLFVTLFYKLIRRPLTKEAENRIHGTGFALLMLLFVLITIVDVKRFF